MYILFLQIFSIYIPFVFFLFFFFQAEGGIRDFCLSRGLGVEAEVFVTAPGAQIESDHPLVASLETSHEEVFGSAFERDVTRWFSDASVLTRYGIATVNYGTSTGLLDTVDGENLDIDGLVKTAEVYARAAQRLC